MADEHGPSTCPDPLPKRPPLPAFGYPFVGTQPVERTRDSFKPPVNKDSLEKTRLASRRECHKRVDARRDPVKPDGHSLSYANDKERFSRGMAEAEHREHVGRMLDRQSKYERRRNETFAREATRHDRRNAEAGRQQAAAQRLSERPVAKNNSSSVSYNPITLRYNDSNEGAELKFQDDSVRYRGAMRARNLYEKKSGQAFNIITGEDRNAERIVPVPNKPLRPTGR